MKLKEPTTICKLCFSEFYSNSFPHLFNKKTFICNQCRTKIKPHFIKFKIDDINCMSIYEYDDFFKTLIYQFKGCNDIELAPIFLYEYSFYLSIKYLGYYMVYVPSYFQDNIDRGFNHVIEIFKFLKLKKIDILNKCKRIKQADFTIKERENIGEYLNIKNNVNLKDKRILIVDDICTSGNTLRACIELIKKCNPKTIKCLVICKVRTNQTENIN